MLLPNTEPEGIVKIAEIIRTNVEKCTIPRIDDPAKWLNITISIGASYVKPTDTASIEDFIKRADEALYKAKENGRNQVCISE